MSEKDPSNPVAKSRRGPTSDAPTSPQEALVFSKEDLLKFIELDLWSRFQERLWRLVGIFLVVTTIAGFFGVPYYINSQLETRLRKIETDFTLKQEAILSRAKAIALLNVAYQAQLMEFNAEVSYVYFAVVGLQEKNAAKASASVEENRKAPPEPPSAALWLLGLLTKTDFSQSLVSASPLFGRAPSLPGDLLKARIDAPKSLSVEHTSPTGDMGDIVMFAHPVYDGTVGGALSDLRFRTIVLDALEKSIEDAQRELVSFGGETDLDKRAEAARIDGILIRSLSGNFEQHLKSLNEKDLDKSQQLLFLKAEEYYLPPIFKQTRQSAPLNSIP